MAKIVAFVSTACLICLLIGIIVYQHLRLGRSGVAVLDAPAIVKEVKPLNELVTVKYGIEKVVGMKEEKSPIGSESILLLVQGKVLAGVDLGALRPEDVRLEGDGVTLRLPAARIQEAFLDEKYTKVWDRSVSWWTPWVTPDLDLEHKARLQAIEEIKATAMEMGILKEAQRNAEADVLGVLRALGVGRVDYLYGD